MVGGQWTNESVSLCLLALLLGRVLEGATVEGRSVGSGGVVLPE